jgi:hypothetical protein
MCWKEKIAKENFEINLDNIILENVSNNKTKIMKMLLKSNKVSGNFPPLQNIINDQNLEEFAYDDEEKYDLLNKYFSFISKLDEASHPAPMPYLDEEFELCQKCLGHFTLILDIYKKISIRYWGRSHLLHPIWI